MEPALKQRLIGAAVLVAIAVIFLPMLIKGPAPESGVSDISLDLPSAPRGGFETRELPLVTPGAASGASVTAPNAGSNGATTDPDALPTVDTRAARADAAQADTQAGDAATGMLPASTAAGDYAVSFGSYASAADAQRVVAALQAAKLPGYQEATTGNSRTLHRVRIGPYESRAAAEAARLSASQVRDDVGAKVVVLDAAPADAASASSTTASTSAALNASVSKPAPLPESRPVEKPAAAEVAKPAPTPTVASKPTKTTPAMSVPEPKPAAVPAPSKPAAANVGFAVQLGAFSNQAEAIALRDRARSAGLSAFIEQVNTAEGKSLTRVQVGPVADRAAADQLKAQAASKLGISGFVRPHP
ncbi:MAG: SPOR domain-containing protein [Lysobacter sp.]